VRIPFHTGSVVARSWVARKRVVCAGTLLLIGIAAPAYAGQAKNKNAPVAKPAPNKPPVGGGAKKAAPPKPVPAEQLEKLLNMNAEERQKAMSKLPPQQQKQLQARLDNLDRQSPAQRQQTLDRLRELEKLPPARQQAVTNQIQSMNKLSFADQREILNNPDFAKNYSPEEQQIIRERFPQAASNVAKPIDKLSPARRQAVNQEGQRIQQMSFPERQQALHSPEFNQNFSPEEQQILRDRFPNAAK
jgi:hypothetical protein